MISNACATMRTAKSFLPLLRPFIIRLREYTVNSKKLLAYFYLPIDEPFHNRHLCLLELLLGITASGMGEVNSVANLDVVSQGNVFNLNANE
jgi:hypothetical protein